MKFYVKLSKQTNTHAATLK